ncbi:molybdopterin cofactor-binding domain-containing protein [Amycolatopsis sp.]|jgi:isoquinoline 1-oxidoreductase beta subunit|uniref:molybdopterin cofactor-binding domain-containing protein n=1 Tax=Amycolatopsis sp. TaxID=37632 RepID=UPI002E073B2A|nr:molybdopterin cofactor-binding domain-containing protein [Amycolatopsis sp.]
MALSNSNTASSADHSHPDDPDAKGSRVLGRRRFLTYLVAGPTLVVAAGLTGEALDPPRAGAAIPTLPGPAEIVDLGDVQVLAALPTSMLLKVEVAEDGRVRFELPRAEVGQGVTTAVAMLVAEELDIPVSQVDVPLADARPELMLNQATGGSTTIRSMYDPVRYVAAAVRARLLAAASARWSVAVGQLAVRDGSVIAPDGREATYGSLSAAAASPGLAATGGQPKPESQHTVVGRPASRIDARAAVTGAKAYTLDLEVPGALPSMVRRPPTVQGSPRSILNEAAVRAMPGIVDVVPIPTGVAVVAETFGQALDGKNALQVTWNDGTIDGFSDPQIRDRLRGAVQPFLVPPLLVSHLDAEFDFAFVSHAPMETNSAIADVRADRAEIWSSLQAPIWAAEQIAAELGLPLDRVVVHVPQGGGAFGRRAFPDAAIEAVRISRKSGRPIKLMWSRIDDMRHGRGRPADHHKIRATFAAGNVLSFEHRMSAVQTDLSHGLGEAITAVVSGTELGGRTLAQFAFNLSLVMPYNLGLVTATLSEVPLKMNTAAWRQPFTGTARTAQEILIDEIAASLGKDPYRFRRAVLKNDKQRAVLDKVATEGHWGRPMPAGYAQGIAFHEEFKSCAAYLVEIDARDPSQPRVTKAVIAADVGLPINPRGLEAQLLGTLTDGISVVLRAGLHFDKGLPLEGSYSQFHYARQKDSPMDVQIFIMPANGRPGGAGELGIAAASGAVANAFSRATGVRPRSFPINFDVDFEPFPR